MTSHNANDMESDYTYSSASDSDSDSSRYDDESILTGRLLTQLAIKTNSYNMFVSPEESLPIPKGTQSSQSAPGHNIIVNLIQQVLDIQAATQFAMSMNLIRHLCKENDSGIPKQQVKNAPAFPIVPPTFVCTDIKTKYGRHCIGKTPAWAVGYALSKIVGRKHYSLEICTVADLGKAADDAFIIQGPLNHLCNPHFLSDHNKHHPADPVINVVNNKSSLKNSPKPKAKKQKITLPSSIVLFVPSTGIYYSPHFIKKTPRIKAWGKVMGNPLAAAQNKLAQLPATALRIRRSDGQCAKGGQLISFDAVVFKIKVYNPCNLPIFRDIVLHQAYHLPDENVLISPDLQLDLLDRKRNNIVGHTNTTTTDKFNCNGIERTKKSYMQQLKYKYLERLANSNSNRAGCKQFPKNSYYQYPLACSDNPLIIDGSSIPVDKEIQIRVVQEPKLNVVGVQSTIRIQHVGVEEFSAAKEKCIKLGRTMKARKGRSSVRDKPLSKEQCSMHHLPYGFDGHMYAIGQHIDAYGLKKHPVDYASTDNNVKAQMFEYNDELQKLFQQQFHWESSTMQNGLLLHDEMPPFYLGGRRATTKTVNMSHNLANSPHFDPYDFGVGYAVWAFDNINDEDHVEQYFMFPNLLTTDSEMNTKKGVIIEICDGLLISWNGNVIRHCTSIRNQLNPLPDALKTMKGDVYSFQFANSMPNIKAYKEIRLEEYITAMNLKVTQFDSTIASINAITNLLESGMDAKPSATENESLEEQEFDWSTEDECNQHNYIQRNIGLEHNIPVDVSNTSEEIAKEFKAKKLELIIPNWEAYWRNLKFHDNIYKLP